MRFARAGAVAVAVVALLVALIGRDGAERAPPVELPRPEASPPRPLAATGPATAPSLGEDVRCEVGRALEGRACHVRPTGSRGTVAGTYEGTTFRFRPPRIPLAGALECPGVDDPISLRWTPTGECTVQGLLPPPADAPIFGAVRGAADLPDGSVFLEGCGASEDDPVDADGRFFVQAPAGRCTLRAWRRAGRLRLPGPWVEVEPLAGVEVEAELAVPTFEPAGLGVEVEPVASGIEIIDLLDGPAAEAGIRPGDVITRLDGVPVDGLAPDEFLELGLGPAGSEVHVEGVDGLGRPFRHSLRRAVVGGD